LPNLGRRLVDKNGTKWPKTGTGALTFNKVSYRKLGMTGGVPRSGPLWLRSSLLELERCGILL
jgi:hypothetical protein